MNTWNDLKHDYRAGFKREPKLGGMIFRVLQDAGFRAMFFYRLARSCRAHRVPGGAALLERLMHHLSHCWISSLAELGPGFRIPHVCGIIIPPKVVFGEYCEVRQNVTIGGNYGKRGPDGQTVPILEDRVSIGPGAVVLGPITVGKDTIIGANAVVTQNIPPSSVVTGFRAEVLTQRDADGKIEGVDRRLFASRRVLGERLAELEARVAELSEKAAGDAAAGPKAATEPDA
jgi:serine O-acetyltransferase